MMDRMMLRAAKESENTPEAYNTNASPKKAMWQELIGAMEDPTAGMSEAERQEYGRRIEQKMKAGKKLTAKELSYLRIHNPELYKIAVRVETSRKTLRQRLKTCKSKQEVHSVVQGQLSVLRSMKGDPAREYMAAMMQREISEFKKSSVYAKLPLKTEQGDKKMKKVLYTVESEDEEDIYSRAVFFGSLQLQCDELSQMTDAVMEF
ncbi:MAG: hypothetical protein J1F02_01790 [Lachnospiraceae bacterium]|nr:hypothetical protein [Lachnospiraceae bacterium]